MNRTLSVVISLVFVIGVAGFVIFFKPNVPMFAANEYANEEQGYALSYPKDLGILEYTPDMATIGHLTEGGIDGVADVRVLIVEGEEGQSLADAAADDLADLCDADGPDTSFSCAGVARVLPFAVDAGETGFELYLKGQLKDRATGFVTDVEKGPYYAFVLSGGATATKLLVVHAPLNLSAAEADASAIEKIAASVRLD